MNIDIIGWYGEHNCGDNAFKIVFEHYLGDHNLCFGQKYQRGDAVIFGGGGVLRDSYLKNCKDVPKFALGVDIALNGPAWDQVLNMSFENIYVRSREYSVIANAQGLKTRYCPDICFGLNTSIQSSNRHGLGIVLSTDLLCFPQIMEWLPAVLDQIKTPITFLSLYNGKNSDFSVNKNVGDRINKEVRYKNTEDPAQMMAWIQEFKQIITMRFHGAIFSTITDTPFISVSNPGKNSLFCEQEFLSDQFLGLSSLTPYKLTQALAYLCHYDIQIRERLFGIRSRNKALVVDTFENIRLRLTQACYS